jgi:hypothetical protein
MESGIICLAICTDDKVAFLYLDKVLCWNMFILPDFSKQWCEIRTVVSKSAFKAFAGIPCGFTALSVFMCFNFQSIVGVMSGELAVPLCWRHVW